MGRRGIFWGMGMRRVTRVSTRGRKWERLCALAAVGQALGEDGGKAEGMAVCPCSADQATVRASGSCERFCF